MEIPPTNKAARRRKQRELKQDEKQGKKGAAVKLLSWREVIDERADEGRGDHAWLKVRPYARPGLERIRREAGLDGADTAMVLAAIRLANLPQVERDRTFGEAVGSQPKEKQGLFLHIYHLVVDEDPACPELVAVVALDGLHGEGDLHSPAKVAKVLSVDVEKVRKVYYAAADGERARERAAARGETGIYDTAVVPGRVWHTVCEERDGKLTIVRIDGPPFRRRRNPGPSQEGRLAFAAHVDRECRRQGFDPDSNHWFRIWWELEAAAPRCRGCGCPLVPKDAHYCPGKQSNCRAKASRREARKAKLTDPPKS